MSEIDYTKNPLAWDIHDRPKNESFEKASKEQAELDKQYLACFKTPAGKVVLEHLAKNTIEAATWMSSLDYNKAIAHGFAREGQNALVRMIQTRIERAKRKP